MVKNTTDIEGLKICYEEQEKDLIKNKKIFLPLEWAANYDQVTFKFNYNQKGDMIKIIVHRRTSIGDIFKQNNSYKK